MKLLFFILILINHCTTQRDMCHSRLITFRGKSFDACSRYFGYEAISRNGGADRSERTVDNLKNYFLLDCLTLIEEEKQCEGESNLIPHIGY
ncbi:hypothetical protein [Leptospira sp. GIMC2001]|uniref:hypothetical protein n=1 Tax=Leptospira sp. GIMC2001 TaxID=1513297 RepID=UPI00234B0B44|nr:hypothetical protein [Leptospira sp. GIMC2001]WCL50987.1 hypothetical protein O4O04_09300 [Leptospira sp. GIMC2001]